MTRVENMNGVYRASGYGLQEMSAWKDTNFGVGSLGVTISIPDKNKVTLGFETEEKDYTQELTVRFPFTFDTTASSVFCKLDVLVTFSSISGHFLQF